VASHNVRPRVLKAVYDLGTFTVAELCRAAGLTDRNQAYAQLDKLRESGFVEQETLPASGPHAPFKQYRLVSDAEKRTEFVKELVAYQAPLRPEPATSEMAELALEEANQSLKKIEGHIFEIEGDGGTDAKKRLGDLNAEFETARTNIQTAQLEYAAASSAKKTQVLQAAERLSQVEAKLEELKAALHARSVKTYWSILRSVVEAISPANPLEPALFLPLIEKLSHSLKDYDRAPMELLLDEMRANPKYPFATVFRHALRTRNRDVLFDVVTAFKNVNLDWCKYNRESTCYLKTSKLNTHHWFAAYESLLDRIPSPRTAHMRVYSYALETLTTDVYLHVTKEQCVSLVSPREIVFLDASEIVKPTLAIETGKMLKTLDCTFLKPNDSLYAYGPIANDIVLWPGAPALRVAACLGMLGFRLKNNLSQITESLKNDRGLLVTEGQQTGLQVEMLTVLRAKEVR
jgi:hypothetical protein